MNKVTVIGCTGSGKTVFSQQLAKKLDIPLYTIDSIYYGDNWQKLSQEQLKEKLLEIMKGERWLIDGQYTKLIPLRLEHVDTVIFFDISKIVSLWRVFKRYFTAKQIGNNKIYFPWHQIKLIWNYPRKRIYGMLNEAKDKNIIIFKKIKAAEQFLATV